MARSTVYIEIVNAVADLIEEADSHPTAAAYMVATAAMLLVRARHGPEKACELAYMIGDEMTKEDPA